jgi:CheY-like chemotaxis protein
VNDDPLPGARVLLVEDETFVSLLLEDMLEELGCAIVGIAQTVARGVALAREATIELAVLDVNVAGEKVTPVADILRERGVPFVFSTGYGAAGLPPEWESHPVVAKPFAIEDLARALREASAARTPGS